MEKGVYGIFKLLNISCKKEMKEKYLQLLKEVKREGIDELIKFLENSDFFTAPASTKFHSAFEGGLCKHSINVYNRFISLLKNEYGESWEEFRKRKREATQGYNKARGEHFQREYYDNTNSKTSAEWHNNKTKRYNPRIGKMEWGEKIGDSLQKSLIDFLYD